MKKLLLLCCLCVAAFFLYANKSTEDYEAEIEIPLLHSQNAILLDESGQSVYEKNADAIIYPASLTKIMTAIVAIEESDDLQKHTMIEASTIATFTAQNASMAGFKAGDFVTVEDLLYGAIIPSGADATATLANVIAGSEKDFVSLMNDKAHELGMNDTHFVNVSGLHDDAHVSSVRDISKLFRYAIENPIFYKILTTRSYITAVPGELTMSSTLFTKMAGVEGAILGGKTGYTPEAGLCLASLLEKNGKYYLFVTTNATGNVRSEPFHVEDALSVHAAL
ncbi:penicillin-binding protein [Lysinibacillus contaminans]|uniref:Penicillin-binding protein n=1 Tax=Lysinibacillus contaminans TaxID=1293441 RepID=A0ABR5K1E0_9BACI|nr:serine hydrolase [Lysinibacillus contaminans]KOS68536.1 penicillin-binding protein [Lysinibacillus contaminans]